jgi:TonB family protein
MRGVNEGRATIACAVLPDGRLGACRITEEVPVGLGFGPAAVVGAQGAQLDLRNSAAPDAEVRFTSRFRVPTPRATIENPAWAQPPRPAFPSSAQRAGIESARVRLDCAITPAGRLRHCVIRQEDPGNLGLGQAAVRAVRDARVLPSELYDTTPDVRAIFDVVFGD